MEGTWVLNDGVEQSLLCEAALECSMKKIKANHYCLSPERFWGVYFGSQSNLSNLSHLE